MKKIDISDFLFHLLVPIILGGAIGFIFKDYTSYIDTLKRDIEVPKTVFPIVWSILYLIIGLWYHFFAKDSTDFDKTVYYLGLVVNLMFTPVLFYFNNIPPAFLIVVLLIIVNLYLFLKSIKKSKLGYLLLPYVVWLCFACILMIDLLVNNMP